MARPHPLRQWRNSRKLSAEACARAVGTSRQVWCSWERGLYRPSAAFMDRIRKFTDGQISADDFFHSVEKAA